MKQKEGDEMRAPTPEDYAYLDQQTDILLTENRMQHERIAALTEHNRQLREALDMMFSSAHPNERDHPAMFCAWKEARAALAATETKP